MQKKEDWYFGAGDAKDEAREAFNLLHGRRATVAADAAHGINGLSPDDEARARALAPQTGQPVEVVRSALDRAQEQADENRRLNTLIRAPMLSLYMRDPHNAALVADDTDNLSAMAKTVDMLRDFMASLPDMAKS
jgi:hypothetical protein